MSLRTGVGCLVLVLLAGCGNRSSQEERPQTTTGTLVRGGTIVIGIDEEPSTLNPYGRLTASGSNVTSFLFMMLVETNADLVSFSPSLARSWAWSDDHKILTMFLRDDVYWSDGVQVTAEDVQFTYDVARDTLVAWRARHWKAPVRSCEIVDRFTVRYHFDEVFPDQLRFAKEGFVVPKHLLQDVPRERWHTSDFGRNPVGSGPFRLASWEPSQRIVLVPNEKFFLKDKPYVDRIVFEIVPDPSSRLVQLRAGQLDLVEDVPGRDALQIRKEYEAGQSRVRITSCRGRYYDFIGYNTLDPLLSSRRVREALTRAIDRQAIIEGHCYGFAELFESPVLPILWAYNPDLPVTPHDPEGALALLQDEGWRDTDGDGWLDRDGERFQLTVLTNAENRLRVDALVSVQRDWKAIGVQAHVRVLEMQTALELRSRREFQAYYGGWRGAVTVNLANLWGCDYVHERFNFTSYCNPRVDSLNAAAIRLPPEQAKPLFYEAQALIAREYPYTWMYYVHEVIGIADRVRGAVIDQRGPYNNPDSWWVADAEQANR